MKFHYATRRGDRGYYYADVLDLPGCTAMGATPAELRDNVRLAVRWHWRASGGRPSGGPGASGGPGTGGGASSAGEPVFEVVDVTATGWPPPPEQAAEADEAMASGDNDDDGSLESPIPSDAAPASVPSAAPPPAPVVRPDDGPFYTLGHRFDPGTCHWVGRAIASPRSIYLLKVRRHTHGTPLGYMAAGWEEPDDLRSCRLSDLPDAVRAALDPWGRHARRDVIVVPRECVSRVSVSRVDNYVRLRAGGHRMTVYTVLFRGIGIARFLTANGWQVNRDVVATAEPTFGHGYGRTEPPPPEDGWALARRFAYIAFGLLGLVAVFAKAWTLSKR